MVDLIHSILYPFANRKNILNTLITGLVNILWFLFIPMIFVNGYYVKIIRQTLNKKEEMPSWPKLSLSEWIYHIKHGFIFTIIMIIYVLIPFGVLYLGTVSKISLLMILLAFLLFLAVLFILPMALIRYAATESFFQAFNFPELFSSIIKGIGNYFVTYLIFIILMIGASTLGGYLPYLSGLFMIIPWIFAMHGFAQVLAKTQ